MGVYITEAELKDIAEFLSGVNAALGNVKRPSNIHVLGEFKLFDSDGGQIGTLGFDDNVEYLVFKA